MPGRGEVSSLLQRPAGARALLALGHGAGTHLRHPFMQRLADALAAAGAASFRYNYPYSEAGRGGMDGERTRLAAVRAAIAAARSAAPDLPCFAGGHSMSGRMTTLAAAQAPIEGLAGIAAFAFPLHPAGRPGTARARHLDAVPVPVLLLNGSRDRLADLELLRRAAAALAPRVRLHVLDGADHSFQTLRRSGKTAVEVVAEAARAAADWTAAAAEQE